MMKKSLKILDSKITTLIKGHAGFFTLLVALCTILILANITMAQRANKGKPGGGNPPAQPLLNVGWGPTGNSSIFEDGLRQCNNVFVGGSGDGNYGCQHSGGATEVDFPDVTYDLPVGVLVRSGNQAFCEAFVGGQMLDPNSSYNVAWDCSAGDGNCRITILNWWHRGLLGGEPVDSVFDDVGAVIIRAFALTPGTPGGNPLANPLTLEPDAVDVTFKANGKNKTIAQCEYRNLTGLAFQVEQQ